MWLFGRLFGFSRLPTPLLSLFPYRLSKKLFSTATLPPPSTCSAAEPTHPTAAQGHNELAYKCWYAQLDAYSNAATVILAGERRRHSVDSRIAMRRTACPDARLGALLRVQEEGQRSCCAGPAVWLKGAAAGAQQQRWRAAQPHHSPAKTRVISRQDLAPKWHFSVHLAAWSRPEAPSFWE